MSFSLYITCRLVRLVRVKTSTTCRLVRLVRVKTSTNCRLVRSVRVITSTTCKLVRLVRVITSTTCRLTNLTSLQVVLVITLTNLTSLQFVLVITLTNLTRKDLPQVLQWNWCPPCAPREWSCRFFFVLNELLHKSQTNSESMELLFPSDPFDLQCFLCMVSEDL
jgi:hypothetical protein